MPSAIDDFPDRDRAAEPAPIIAPIDPACVAARLLLRRALAAAGVPLGRAGADGTVTLILLPASDWTKVTRDAWKDLARGGQAYQDGSHSRGWYDGGWAAWTPMEQQRPTHLKDAQEFFATAVSEGVHCAAFTADTAWLPVDIVHAADHTLTLPALTGTDIEALAEGLCGGQATETLDDSRAALLTPRLLKLGRRPGQTAADYVRKLRGLLERDIPQVPATPASTSPRDVPTLDRLHGMDEAVRWGKDVARDLAKFTAGELPWSAVDRGCLVSGPPGCGKTLFARALATTCGVPLIAGSYGEWLGTGNGHQGDLLRAMRATFATARASAPAVLFIDEVDSFPDRGTITHHYADWEIQVVNALLTEIDGVEGRPGVVLVAACNHPERLDPALVRSGRLDRHLRVGLPGRLALGAILREHLGGELCGDDLSGAALAAAGTSGADCERFVRGARRRARTAEREMVLADLLDEIGGADDRSAEDLWTSAVHEAGHAVAAHSLLPGSVGMVSLRASRTGGGTTEATVWTSVLVRPADLTERLAVFLAGRAAEEEILGVVSSGAGGRLDSDLARATALAVKASAAFGLDELGGLVWRGMPEPHLVPQALAADVELAGRVRIRMDEGYAAARALLRPRRAALEALAAALLKRRVLDGADVDTIMQSNAPDMTVG